MWLEHVLEGDYLCYDITSVSSARHNEYTHYGYNRDNEQVEQINLAMLFGQNGPVEKWEGSDKNFRNWPKINWPIHIISY